MQASKIEKIGSTSYGMAMVNMEYAFEKALAQVITWRNGNIKRGLGWKNFWQPNHPFHPALRVCLGRIINV